MNDDDLKNIKYLVYNFMLNAFFDFQALDLDSIKTHHWLIQDCSAVTGENLLKGVDWIIDDIASRIFTMD